MSHPPSPEKRRASLLSVLYFRERYMASVRELVQELDTLHNIPASADQVRGDLTWLQEQDFVRLVADLAKLTERGIDVAIGRAPWPGR